MREGRGKKGSPLEEAQIQFSGRRTPLQIVQAHRVHVHGNSKVQAQPTKAKLVGKRESQEEGQFIKSNLFQ